MLLICSALGVFTLSGCDVVGAAADEPEQWRFAIEEPMGSVQHAYAKKFEELIEKRSGGAIEVTVYPYGTLGTSDQITELLDMNVLQFAMASPGHLGKLIPEVQVLLLHFVFSDDEAVNNRVLNEDEELRAAFDALYAEKNLKLLSMYSEGWQVWTTQVPVLAPEDFAGVKFRVMTTPLLIAAYEAYGASATPLPYSEVYSGLQLQMIEGQENPVFAIQEMSFYEVTDWMIFAKHAPFVTTAVTNREFFESLSPKRRELVTGVVDDLNEYILEVQQEYNRERLETIRERLARTGQEMVVVDQLTDDQLEEMKRDRLSEGKDELPDLVVVENLTDEQRDAFRQRSKAVRERFVEMTGPEGERVLEQLLEAVERQREAE